MRGLWRWLTEPAIPISRASAMLSIVANLVLSIVVGYTLVGWLR